MQGEQRALLDSIHLRYGSALCLRGEAEEGLAHLALDSGASPVALLRLFPAIAPAALLEPLLPGLPGAPSNVCGDCGCGSAVCVLCVGLSCGAVVRMTAGCTSLSGSGMDLAIRRLQVVEAGCLIAPCVCPEDCTISCVACPSLAMCHGSAGCHQCPKH